VDEPFQGLRACGRKQKRSQTDDHEQPRCISRDGVSGLREKDARYGVPQPPLACCALGKFKGTRISHAGAVGKYG
jgi:hypothetical protein